MNALDFMRGQMHATGLYSLSGNTVADAELESYAVGLNDAADALAELERELFVPTACGYGFALRERMFVLTAQGDEAQRRSAVEALGAVTPRGFTREALQQTFCAIGIACEFCENANGQTIYLNIFFGGGTQEERNKTAETAKRFLPAHLGAELDFRSISWNNIDQAAATFDACDTAELPWDSIDQYENALLRI